MSSGDQHTITPRDFDAALAWWADAGVDHKFHDDPTDWLKKAEEKSDAPGQPSALKSSLEHAEEPTTKKVDLLGPTPPSTLDEFREWWLTELTLDGFGPKGRVPPRGPVGAKLMLLVVDPEQGDQDMLLSQAQGRLVGRMLAAMQIDEVDVYIASALPRHTPMVDTASLMQAGLAEVLQHHIGLVRPERVIAFGSRILPLLGHEATQEPASLQKIEHAGLNVAALAAEGLDSMIAMPRLKSRFWRRWLDWMGT